VGQKVVIITTPATFLWDFTTLTLVQNTTQEADIDQLPKIYTALCSIYAFNYDEYESSAMQDESQTNLTRQPGGLYA